MDKVSKLIVDKSLTQFTLRVHKYVNQFKADGYLVTAGVARFDKDVYSQEITGERFEKPYVHDIVKEHVVCKDVVHSVLEKFPETRNNDLLLILQVWRRQGVSIGFSDDELGVMLNPESITRARRVIKNNDGEYLPTKLEVAEKRRLNEELLREHYG